MFAIFMLLAAQPDAAPRCELEGISPVDLVALRVAMLEQVTNGTPRPASATTTLDAIEAKAAACSPGEDATADKAAATVAVARFAADTVGEKLAAEGIDMAKVDATVKDADPAVLDALIAKQFETAGVSEFAERVTAVAGSDAKPEVRRLLGAYAFNAARVSRGAASQAAPAPEPKPAPTER